MKYRIKASSIFNEGAFSHVKQSNMSFGTISETSETLPNPTKLVLRSVVAGILKNEERFFGMMKFRSTKAEVNLHAVRLENPPRMDNVIYDLTIHSDDKKLSTALLQKYIEIQGAIYNTVISSITISGSITQNTDV